ncbi:MAG: class I SAM-dependent methyltransferase [Syntrophobacteraceae bacterium]
MKIEMVTHLKIEMVTRLCPVCGSADQSHIFAEADFDPAGWDEYAFASRKIPEYMHYRLISCPRCDLLYASPLPVLEMLAQAYMDAAYDSGTESEYAGRTYAGFLPAIMRRLPDLDGALDIGTGDGAFLAQLLAHGFDRVVGVEPSEAAMSAAIGSVKPLIRHGLFRVEDFRDERFSLVTCFQTVEHLYDPLKICSDVFTLLKPGGAIFLICHNRRSSSALFLGLKSPIFDVEHLQLFSYRSASFLLDKAGFKNIETRPVLNRYPLHYWLKLLPLPRKLKQEAFAYLRRRHFGNLSIPLPAGNLAVVGYKSKSYSG